MKIMYTHRHWQDKGNKTLFEAPIESYTHPVLVQDAEGFPEGWEVGSRVRNHGTSARPLTVSAIYHEKDEWWFNGITKAGSNLRLRCAAYRLVPPETTVTLRVSGKPSDVEGEIGVLESFDHIRVERVEDES